MPKNDKKNSNIIQNNSAYNKMNSNIIQNNTA